MKSWNLMGPAVVSASKSGAMEPSRRLQYTCQQSHLQIESGNIILTVQVVLEP